jgi:murein DD-endopeptidase MepM/ murein hydrolase activator NlpD
MVWRVEEKLIMRLFIRKMAMAGFVVALLLTIVGTRNPVTGALSAAAAQETDDQVKIDIYKKFYDNHRANPTVAYQAARDYVQRYPKDKDQYTEYLRQWMSFYERDDRKRRLPILINEKNFSEAFRVGNQILTDEPDFLRTQIDLGYAGYLSATYCTNALTEAGDTIKKIAQRCNVSPEEVSRLNNNVAVDNPLPVGQTIKLPPAAANTFTAESLANARKAIQAIESGKAPSEWTPYKGKDDTLAHLYYAMASLNLRTAPEQSIDALLKAASFNSELKKSASTYFYLAYAYETGPYRVLSTAYQQQFADKPETPQSKAALEKLNIVIDRMIDAYARAVAAAGTDAKVQQAKAGWMATLTNYYKFRNGGSDAGLQELIAGVLSKPLPPKPQS